MKFIVAVGNPFDGMTLHGAFKDREEAEYWAESLNESWWELPINQTY
mgnify:CR=1 FL=1